MKSRLFLLILLLGFFGVSSYSQAGIVMGDLTKKQQDSIIFAFPGCTDGTVYFKNGDVVRAKLNYNYYEPQVLFYNDKPEFEGDSLRRLDNLADVLLIEIGDRSFVPVLGGLGEIILNHKVKLILSKKVNIEEKKTGAYGTGGSTSSIRSVSGVSNNGTAGGGYTGQTSFTNVEYDFSKSSELNIDIRLFLMKDDKIAPITKKNLTKYFPQAAGFIKQYIEEQNPDLDNPEQMINMINLANANEK